MLTSRRALPILLSLILLTGCSAQPKQLSTRDPLAAKLDSILHRRDDGNTVFGARVIDLKTGKEIYAHDIDRPLMPASNGKLPVSAAGLDFFGPDHTFKTYLAVEGDDLWLIGTGDPACGDPAIAKANKRTTTSMLDDWVAALRKRGITHIKGQIRFYDGALEAERVHPSWSKDFAGDWYAAPVSGLNFNDNCVDVKVIPGKPGAPVSLTVVPATKFNEFINTATSAAKSAAAGGSRAGSDGEGDESPRKSQLDIKRDPDANVFHITGAATQPTDLPSTSVVDPGAFFADALRTHLISHGIPVDGGIERADKPIGGKLVPPPAKTIAVHETKMSDVMWRINKSSQNLFAEAMCKMLGREWTQKSRAGAGATTRAGAAPGSWSTGGEAVKAFLTKNNIDTSNYVIIDGSGLSRENRVTVRIISDVLVTMNKHPSRDAFRSSLSIAGKDGTLKTRLKDLPPNSFIGKTGYIGSVRSLSGILKTRSGDELVVSIIYNGFKGSVKPYEELQDEAVRTLFDWPKVSGK